MKNTEMKYLLRLDDASPFMDMTKWGKITDILIKYNIRPLVGIVPNNQDPQISFGRDFAEYQSLISEWKKQGWSFALHGFTHVYCTRSGGINPIHRRSEFAGLSYDLQYEKISKGYELLAKQGVIARYFYAPSHTFDENTIRALKEASPIKIVSDTIALKPYRFMGITFIPQQVGRFRNIKIPGVWTFCYHPNNMLDKDFLDFESFIKNHRQDFSSFPQIPEPLKGKSIADKLLSQIYFQLRKLLR